MSVVQSTYTENQPIGSAGAIATMADSDVITRICEVEAGIGFGLAIGQGTADKGCVLGGALAGFLGLSVRDVTLDSVTPDEYEDGDNVAVMAEGEMWVVAAAAVEAGQAVHYNATTGALSNTGGNGPIVGARWMTSAAQDGLAKVRLTAGQTGASA